MNVHRDSMVLLFSESRFCILTRRDLRIVGLLHFLCVCWVPLAARGATVPAASCLSSVCVTCACVHQVMAQTSAKQKWQQKLLFVNNALEQPDPFKADPAVRADVEGAKKWIADHRPDVVFEDREETMQCIERHAQKLWASGEVDRWFLGCDAGVRRVS